MSKKLIAFMLCAILAISVTACSTGGEGSSTAGIEESSTGADQAPEAGEEISDVPKIPDAHAFPDDAVAATLGDNTIPAINYAYFFLVYKNNLEYNALMSGYGPGDMDLFWNMEQGGVTVKQMLLEEAMRAAKEYTALYEMAESNGVTEDDEDSTASGEQVASLLTQVGEDEQEFLNTYRLTPPQMKEAMRRVNTAAKYYAGALESATVSEAEIKALYDADPDAYDLVTVRHVLISCDAGMSQEEQDAAKTKADEVLALLDGGGDMALLAAEYSEDPGSKDSGGEYTFGKGEMVPEFEQWAYASQPGDTGIVKTDYGYHIMQMVGRTSFADIDKAQLEGQVRNDKFYSSHKEIYDLVQSDKWEANQEIIDQLSATLSQY